MSTIQRVVVTVLGGILSAVVIPAIVLVLGYLAGFRPPDTALGVFTLAIFIGAIIVIWRRTGSGQDVVNVSSETPQEVSSNIISVIENVPVNQCPKFVFDAINKQRAPFAQSLTKIFRGRTYLYTVTGAAPNVKTIAHVTRQRLR